MSSQPKFGSKIWKNVEQIGPCEEQGGERQRKSVTFWKYPRVKSREGTSQLEKRIHLTNCNIWRAALCRQRKKTPAQRALKGGRRRWRCTRCAAAPNGGGALFITYSGGTWPTLDIHPATYLYKIPMPPLVGLS
jgi:hypothetical protein